MGGKITVGNWVPVLIEFERQFQQLYPLNETY